GGERRAVGVGGGGGGWRARLGVWAEGGGGRGEGDGQDKAGRPFEKKSERGAHPPVFSGSARFLDTTHSCRPAPTIRITKSPRQTFGAMIRVRRITIAISLLIRKIRRTITRTKKCARAILPTTG